MRKEIFFTSVLIIFYCFHGLSQSPGGVSANLKGWYDANSSFTLTGGAVSAWGDRSGNANTGTQATAARRPVPSTVFNYNSAFTFDGNDDYVNIPDLVPTGATAMSAFAVARQTNTNRDVFGCILVGQTNNIGASGGYGITAQVAGNNAFGFFVRDFGVNYVSYNTTLSQQSIMSGIWNGTTANNVEYFQDGTSRGIDPFIPGTVGDNGNSYIGSGIGAGTDYCFYGDIAEIAVYSSGLTSANVNAIESYFAIKYGIELPGNYVNSSGTVIYNTSAPYNNDMIGICRDDNSGVTQRQSRTMDDSTRLFINTLAASNSANGGSFSSDNQYLVIGDNGGRLHGGSNEKPAALNGARIQREWKVTNTGFTGTFAFSMRLDAAGVPGSVNPAHLRLLVDDDGNFADASVINSGITFAYSNPIITVSGIDNTLIPANSTKYITIGSNVAATPLPVTLTDLQATVCDPNICVTWKTASEKNNRLFEILRSNDGAHWETAGDREGAGNSVQPVEYSFEDTRPFRGINYYQLRQIDWDGMTSMSPVVSAAIGETKEIRTFPVPARDEIFVSGLTNDKGVKVLNGTGSLLNVPHLTTSEGLRFDTSNLPDGIYFIETGVSTWGSEPQRLKFVIHR
jgi:hypothetical protein